MDLKNNISVAQEKLELIRETRRQMVEWAKQNISEKEGLTYNVNVNEFSKLTIRRRDIKKIIQHVHEDATDAYSLCTRLNKVIENSEYIGMAYDKKVVLDSGKTVQKHPDVGYWLYYKFKLNKKYSYLCVMYDSSRNEYRPYCIRDSKFNTNQIMFPAKK